MHDTTGQVADGGDAVEGQNSLEGLLRPDLADTEATQKKLLLFGVPLCGESIQGLAQPTAGIDPTSAMDGSLLTRLGSGFGRLQFNTPSAFAFGAVVIILATNDTGEVPGQGVAVIAVQRRTQTRFCAFACGQRVAAEMMNELLK
ncbi:hypothetical protein ACFL5O_09010 [Myxococcota bacterium]